jgi:hypothetical protein
MREMQPAVDAWNAALPSPIRIPRWDDQLYPPADTSFLGAIVTPDSVLTSSVDKTQLDVWSMDPGRIIEVPRGTEVHYIYPDTEACLEYAPDWEESNG